MIQFKTLLVPDWIERALRAQHKGLSDLCDYDTVRELLSPEDVLYLLKFQNLNTATFEGGVLGANLYHLSSIWSENTKNPEELNTLVAIAQKSVDQYDTFIKELLTRFSTASVPGTLSTAFEIHDLSKDCGPDQILYAICLGADCLNADPINTISAENQYELTQAMVKALYARLPVTEVVLLPVSKHYVELLKNRINLNTY